MLLNRFFLLVLLVVTTSLCRAESAPYRINPGDVLTIYVWNEKDLTQEVLVHPDGMIGLPLAGQLQAGGLTAEEAQKSITASLAKYMKDEPSVSVAIKQTNGYKIYVLGKVNKPGEYPVSRPTDVMQALALAAGLNAYAAENNINVLRREKDGSQKSIHFRYSDVKNGDDLKSNILLESGDVVVVP